MNNLRGAKKIGAVLIVLGVIFPVSALGASENVTFNVDSAYDREARFEHNTFLVKESEHAYFYLDREYWKDLSTEKDWEVEKEINALAQEFDEHIYPKLRAFWGSEWRPGIDDDKKITVLISQLEGGVGGYFNPRDEFPQEKKENSNEREMVYLNTKYLQHPRLKSFLAHEFQHLISFNQKNRLRGFSDDIWLNDMRSEYSPTLLGYDKNFATSNLRYRINSFENSPYVSLTKWNNSDLDYGVVSLFGHYVENVYGKGVLRRTSFQSVPGIKSLQASLRKEGYKISFSELYTDWVLASLLNDSSLKKENYAYTSPGYLQDVEIEPVESITFRSEDARIKFSDQAGEWAWRNYKFKNNGDFEANSIELNLENQEKSKRGTLRAKIVTKDEEGNLQEVRNFNLKQGAGKTTVSMGGGIESVNLIVFNEYRGEYPSGNLDKEAEIKFEITAAPSKSEFELNQIEPQSILNRPGEISLTGLKLDSVQRVKIGDQTIKEFEKKTEDELIFQFDKFEISGLKDLRLETKGASLERKNEIRVFEPLKEGKLIRGEFSSKLYVVKGAFKRHVVSPKIIDMYPHLSLGEIQILKPKRLELYQESNLVRPAGEEKVYRVDEEGKKHWLDLSAREFEESGRSWNEVYLISKKEAQFYPKGEPIRN